MDVTVWMKWKRWATVVTAGLLVSSVAACGGGSNGASGGGQPAAGNAGGSAPAKLVQEVRMGTSSSGSDYYVLTTGMSNIINKNTQLKTSVVAAGGSDATARAIADNKADMGMLNLWSLTNAFQGKPPFDKPVPVRQVLDGQPTGYYLIARAASGIQTPADLKGKRLIGKRPALQSIDEFTAAMLSAYGMTTKDVNLISTADTNEAIQALEQGTVDAAVLPGGVDAPPQQQLAENTPVRFVPIPDDKLQQIIAHMTNGAVVVPIPDGKYKGQPNNYKIAGYPSVLAASANLPDDVVYTITKTLMEHPSDLAAVYATGKEWTLQNTLANTQFAVPFHPGAIKYFKEKGLWTDQLQQRQDELLKQAGGAAGKAPA